MMKPTQKYLKIITLVFMLLIGLWFTSWASQLTPNLYSTFSGPDERLRMLVPTYIYHHHSLPSGYDPEVIYNQGDWSYAFYPQFLGAITSALLMSFVSVFSNTDASLLFGARLASVLFGTLTVYIFGLTIRKLIQERRHAVLYSYFAMVILVFWPQFAFLSAYVNNDIVALFGVSLIIYASALGLKDRWSVKSAGVLGLGFTVCLLGYTNSWGFILCGGLFFLVTLIQQYKTSLKYAIKPFLIACLIPLIFAGPFFIRNAIIYQGDFLGLKTFRNRSLAWEAAHNTIVQGSYSSLGYRPLHIFHDTAYWTNVLDSFIGKFGYMTVSPANELLVIYKTIIIVGLISFFVFTIINLFKRGIGNHKNNVLFWLSLIAASIITVGLSLYYTLTIDIQSQGRYIIYLLIPLILMSVLGLKFIIDRITLRRRFVFIILGIIAASYILNTLVIFKNYIAY